LKQAGGLFHRMAIASIIALALTFSAVSPDAPGSSQTPCWERDAFPILKRNCIACHGSGSAMGNLSLPDSARFRSERIRQNLSSRKMPMRGELREADRNTLISWVEQGAIRCP
jgi:mono/diheme cytochrome c family protein